MHSISHRHNSMVSKNWDPCHPGVELMNDGGVSTMKTVDAIPHLMCPFPDHCDDDMGNDDSNNDDQEENAGLPCHSLDHATQDCHTTPQVNSRRNEKSNHAGRYPLDIGHDYSDVTEEREEKEDRLSMSEDSRRRRRWRRQCKDETASLDRFSSFSNLHRRCRSGTNTDDSSATGLSTLSCASEVASSSSSSSVSWGTRVLTRLGRRKPRDAAKETEAEGNDQSEDEEDEDEQYAMPILTMVDIFDSDGPHLQQSVISLLSSHSLPTKGPACRDTIPTTSQIPECSNRNRNAECSSSSCAVRTKDRTRHFRSESWDSGIYGRCSPRAIDTVWSVGSIEEPDPRCARKSESRHRRVVSFPPELPSKHRSDRHAPKKSGHRRVVSFPPELERTSRTNLPPMYPRNGGKRGRVHMTSTMAEF